MLSDAKRNELAIKIAEDLKEQNHMLEISRGAETDVGIGVFDDYDNKFYDTTRLADIAIQFISGARN